MSLTAGARDAVKPDGPVTGRITVRVVKPGLTEDPAARDRAITGLIQPPDGTSI